MYVYLESEPGLWTVGFYDPNGNWTPESDHDTRQTAANRVAWLNGSTKQSDCKVKNETNESINTRYGR